MEEDWKGEGKIKNVKKTRYGSKLVAELNGNYMKPKVPYLDFSKKENQPEHADRTRDPRSCGVDRVYRRFSSK